MLLPRLPPRCQWHEDCCRGFSMRESHPRLPAITVVALLLLQTLFLTRWSSAQSPTPPQQPQSQPQQQQQPDQTAPEAGGPGNDNGPIAIPKKAPNAAPPPPPEPTVKNPPGLGNLSLRVDVPVVNVDVGVLADKTHQF